MKIFNVHFKAQLTVFAFLIAYSCFAQTQVLYGLTFSGGKYDEGAIIIFNPSTNKESVVWSFLSPLDGANPYGNLVYDTSNDLFYGMSPSGGANNEGAIFSLDPVTNNEKVVWNFGNGLDGKAPFGDLIYYKSNGLFYGMTFLSASNDYGNIITFNPNTNKDSIVWSFGNGTDGQAPLGDLIYDLDNELFYGMTSAGGNSVNCYNGCGAVISFNPNTNKENMLWSFGNGTDGETPARNLVYDPINGLFYGMTSNGGIREYGAIISFNPITNRDSVVWNFVGGTDGKYPNGDLVYNASNELFYGMTSVGGSGSNASGQSAGTIFTFNPTTNKESVVWNFAVTQSDGSNPEGDLVYNPTDSLYYGMTTSGGNNGSGTIISFDPITNKENVVWNFGKGIDGQGPRGSLVLYTPNITTGINVIGNNSASVNIYPNPAGGKFTATGLTEGRLMELYNYQGQKISSLKVENALEQIDISDQANGIYLVRILNADGIVTGQKKIVKTD